jgi:broad specificity phosphatase PhoE
VARRVRGLTLEECAERHPHVWQAWRDRLEPPPGAEARTFAVSRLAGALERSAGGEGGPVLVVSHGGVIRLWLSEVRGEMAPPISNTAVYTVEHDGLGVPRAGLLSDLGGDPENRSESS